MFVDEDLKLQRYGNSSMLKESRLQQYKSIEVVREELDRSGSEPKESNKRLDREDN